MPSHSATRSTGRRFSSTDRETAGRVPGRPTKLGSSTPRQSAPGRLAPKPPAGSCGRGLLARGRIWCFVLAAIEHRCHLPREDFCLDFELAGDFLCFLEERCGSFPVVFGTHGVLPGGASRYPPGMIRVSGLRQANPAQQASWFGRICRSRHWVGIDRLLRNAPAACSTRFSRRCELAFSSSTRNQV